MRSRTRLNADETGRQRREELQQLRSGDALADHYRASGVHAVNLKNRLRDIETDRANLAHGRHPSKWFVSNATTLWHFDAAEWAPSTASEAAEPGGARQSPMSAVPPIATKLERGSEPPLC